MNTSRIQRAWIPLIILIILGMLLIGGVSATEFGPWSLQTVASTGNVGQYSSIALNAAGNPAISFYDQTNGVLKYASWNGAGWVISTVDSSRNVGQYSSLALDGSGNPRISYYDATNKDLKYASWNGAGWVITTVDGNNYKKGQPGANWDNDHGRYEQGSINVGQYSSLALDGSGNPRISYYDQTNGNLKYASWNGAVWVISTVDSSRNVGQYSSLALDSSGNPRISYYDQTNKDLKYASWNGTRWVITTVDGTNYVKAPQKGCNWDRDHGWYEQGSINVGQYSSLAIDGSGNPRISYYDQTNGDLKYAFWDGSRWVISTADRVKDVGEYSSLKLDVTANPRISYYDATHANLKFAGWNSTTSTWVTETVDSSTQVGTYTSLALDSLGNPRISYYDQKNQDLKYAAGTGHIPRLNPPTVTGITPSSGVAGTLVSGVSIAGTNFVVGTTPIVWLAKSGASNITATAVTVVSSSQITCTLPLPAPSTTSAGLWDVVVKNADGQSGTLSAAFTVTNPAPTVTGITPNTGVAGNTVSITNLAGTGFVSGATVNLTMSGSSNITATSVTVVSPTNITCTLTLPVPSVTSAGQWNVVVTNTDGQSMTLANAFTVTNPAPTVTNINPSTGLTGTFVSGVSITGTNFVVGTTPTVWLAKSGASNIYASAVTVISPTQITCTLQLPVSSATPAGTWDLVVQNADGQSVTSANAFTVTNPPPTVTGIAPTSGVAGSQVSGVSITGTNFLAGTTPTVWLAKSGASNITATVVTVNSLNLITCTFTLPGPSATSAGLWDVVVQNADGQSGSLSAAFTVTNPAPTVTGITPSTGVAGTTVPITNLAGTGFVSGATVTLTKSGSSNILATSVTVISPTQITCTLPLPAPSLTTAGQWNVVVTNADGQSVTSANAFTVTNPAPTVTGISPATGVAGSPVSGVIITGTNFVVGTTPTVWLAMSGQPNIAASVVTVTSPTQITCNLPTLPSITGSIGAWDVDVQNADGQLGVDTGAFTITYPPPSVTSISPDTGVAGTTVPVTISGENFNWGPNPSIWLAMFGQPNITATDINVIHQTTINCVFTIPASAPAGSWSIMVLNPDGVTASKIGAFTVTAASTNSQMWTWSTDGWTGWQPQTICPSGTTSATCSEYSQTIVNGYGVYGSNLDPAANSVGTMTSSVTKTFTAPTGSTYGTITFTGMLSSVPSSDQEASVSSMTINVNGANVYTYQPSSAGDFGQQFTFTQSFTAANSVSVQITITQNPIYVLDSTLYTMQLQSLTLSS